jgi:hypothetical protein
VKLFWEAMESFSHEERRKFLMFVWGRSRLPDAAWKFTQRFTIGATYRPWPESHSCFFKIDLPVNGQITELHVMQERLRIAFNECTTFEQG